MGAFDFIADGLEVKDATGDLLGTSVDGTLEGVDE